MSLPRPPFRVLPLLLLILLPACGGEGAPRDAATAHAGAAPGADGATPGTHAAAAPRTDGAAPAAAAPAPQGAPSPGPASPAPAAAAPSAAEPLRVLVLSGGGYHDFGGNLDTLLTALVARAPFRFTRLRLGPDAPGAAPPPPQAARAALGSSALAADFDAVLAYTQGELGLTDLEKAALLGFVRGGGGYVALHCAVDSHPGWAEYVALCGGRFLSHPPFGEIRVGVDVAAHPVTAGLPAEWSLRDEFYHLQDVDLAGRTLLMSGISPEGGERRPVAWCSGGDATGAGGGTGAGGDAAGSGARASGPAGEGRVVATILGHGPEVHGDARYQQLVAQALLWSAGRAAAPAPDAGR